MQLYLHTCKYLVACVNNIVNAYNSTPYFSMIRPVDPKVWKRGIWDGGETSYRGKLKQSPQLVNPVSICLDARTLVSCRTNLALDPFVSPVGVGTWRRLEIVIIFDQK